MTYSAKQAPPLSPAQAERMNRWWAWRREQDRILDEAFAAFKANDMAGFLRLDAARKAIPEPDIYNA